MGSFPLNLVVFQGSHQWRPLEFQPGALIRIGRHFRGNTFSIKDAGISIKHLCIEFDFNSAKWVVQDLESSSGTFLNGTRLTSSTPFDLNDGDSIKLGEQTSILIKIDCHEFRLEAAAESQGHSRMEGKKAENEGNIGEGMRTRRNCYVKDKYVEIDQKTDAKVNKGAEKLDLEKMTVANWFDYLEVHLPAQIIDETEKIIEDMKKKAARVRDYALQQMKEKKNLPLA